MPRRFAFVGAAAAMMLLGCGVSPHRLFTAAPQLRSPFTLSPTHPPAHKTSHHYPPLPPPQYTAASFKAESLTLRTTQIPLADVGRPLGTWPAFGALAAAFAYSLRRLLHRLRPPLPPGIGLPPSAPNVHSIWPSVEANGYGDTLCVIDEHHRPPLKLTYSQMRRLVQDVAAGLQSLGVKRGTPVALFAENSARWLAVDQAVLTCGGFTAVRGAGAPLDELLFIAQDSEASVLVCETAPLLEQLLKRMADAGCSPPVACVVLFGDDPAVLSQLEDQLAALNTAPTRPRVLSFAGLQALGESEAFQEVEVLPSDLATLVYTSGTTGRPKGAMLTHANLLTEMQHVNMHDEGCPDWGNPRPGDVSVSLLPIWHIYERATEYWLLAKGTTLVYSSKKRFKQDLATHRPHFLFVVPRVLDLLYTGVQQKLSEKPPFLKRVVAFLIAASREFLKAKRVLLGLDLFTNIRYPDGPGLVRRVVAALTMAVTFPLVALADALVWKKVRDAVGGRLKVATAGGASFPMHLEDFYEMAGVPVLVGYGLTETSPVIASRRLDHNIRGTTGPSMACTLQVVDEHTGQVLPPLTPGVVRVKGPQVMAGYYRSPGATAKAFDSRGFFDTGDTGYLLKSGELVVSGRVKDVIVLSNGENVEPAPIEDAIMSSPLVDQVLLVGQGQRGLGALVVPNLKALAARGLVTDGDQAIADRALESSDEAGLAALAHQMDGRPALWQALHRDINAHVKQRKGYRPEEQIIDFRLVLAPFSIENRQLTQTLKVRRNVVEERYDGLVGALFRR